MLYFALRPLGEWEMPAALRRGQRLPFSTLLTFRDQLTWNVLRLKIHNAANYGLLFGKNSVSTVKQQAFAPQLANMEHGTRQ